VRGAKGAERKGKGQLSSAFDRISERITLAFQTLSRLEASRGQPTLNFIRGGGESVSQLPLKDKVFSTFLHLSYGRRTSFA
jgi:hypothetical protein